MTAYRSELIREVETDLIQARARGMVKVPRFAGRTYTEVRAARAKHRRLVLRWAGWVTLAMIACAFAFHLVPR